MYMKHLNVDGNIIANCPNCSESPMFSIEWYQLLDREPNNNGKVSPWGSSHGESNLDFSNDFCFMFRGYSKSHVRGVPLWWREYGSLG